MRPLLPLLQDDLASGPANSPEAVYRERATRFAQLREHYRQRSYRTGNLTIALFLGALASVIVGAVRGSAPLLLLALALGIGFVGAFVHQGQLDRQHRRATELCALNEEGLARLRRAWSALPLRQPPGETPDSPLAADLDLLGHASLQHLLSGTEMAVGQDTLRRWLLEPAAPETIRARQAAVAELTPLLESREELALGGRLMGEAQASYLRFLDWAEGAPWLRARPWLVWLTRLLPVLTLVAIVLSVRGLTPYPLWL
ncbi:MAG: hypothetical protein IVW57_14675, partial [Ktedonobacterales bacterium]|nr:hypothetical protein [Ktedonobacterales bacterium]